MGNTTEGQLMNEISYEQEHEVRAACDSFLEYCAGVLGDPNASAEHKDATRKMMGYATRVRDHYLQLLTDERVREGLKSTRFVPPAPSDQPSIPTFGEVRPEDLTQLDER